MEKRILMVLAVSFCLIFSSQGTLMGKKHEAKKHKKSYADNLTEDELYDRAMQRFEKKKWEKARDILKEYQLRFPSGKYLAESKIAIADTYFMERKAENKAEALAEYRSFMTFYPRHPLACKAQFRIASYYFKEMARAQRDQTNTKKAVEELEKLVRDYTGCEHSAEAEAMLRKAKDRLSEADYRVGLFYFKTKAYSSALNRFEYILKHNPAYGDKEELYTRAIECCKKIKDDEKAKTFLEKLREEYPKSRYVARSK
jgi:outer membrane protein assembly factor BamD